MFQWKFKDLRIKHQFLIIFGSFLLCMLIFFLIFLRYLYLEKRKFHTNQLTNELSLISKDISKLVGNDLDEKAIPELREKRELYKDILRVLREGGDYPTQEPKLSVEALSGESFQMLTKVTAAFEKVDEQLAELGIKLESGATTGQTETEKIVRLQQRLQERENDLRSTVFSSFEEMLRSLFIVLLFFLAASAGIVVLGIEFVRLYIRNPIRRIESRLLKLLGSLVHNENTQHKNGLQVVEENINALEKNLLRATDFAKKIGNRELEFEIGNVNEGDTLTKSLHEMRNQLKKITQEEYERGWSREGISIFSDVLRSHQNDLDELSQEIVSHLVRYLKVNQGALFILNDELDEPVMELRACYAYERKKRLKKEIKLGQGLVGQSWYERQTIYLTDVPNEYAKITSGLGTAKPTCILIVPLKVNDNIFGALEIAAFEPLKEYEIHFVEQLAESIASSIGAVKTNNNTRKLLQESQEMTEQLRSQEEEMRQNMEELQATQEEVNRKGMETQRLLEESNKKTESMQMLLDVSAKIGLAKTVESACRTSLESICLHTQWPVGHVYMVEGSQLIPSKIWYMSDLHRFGEFKIETEKSVFVRGKGLPGRVLESGKAEWIIDVTKDSNFPRAQAAEQAGLLSAFAFPIIENEEVIAVMEFYSSKTEEPDELILDLMNHVGKFLGGIMQNLVASSEVLERQREMEMLQSELEEEKQELEESKNYVVNILDGIPEGIIIINESGTITDSNTLAKEYLSIHEEVEGLQNIAEFFPEIELAQYRASEKIYTTLFQHDKPEQEVEILTRDIGNDRVVLVVRMISNDMVRKAVTIDSEQSKVVRAKLLKYRSKLIG